MTSLATASATSTRKTGWNLGVWTCPICGIVYGVPGETTAPKWLVHAHRRNSCVNNSSTSNRVTDAIVSMDANILDRIEAGKTTRAEVDATDKYLNMDLEEYTTFQRLKSLASMSRVLTLDEARTIYGYLGNTVEHYNRQSVAVKVVLTRIFSELLAGRIGGESC